MSTTFQNEWLNLIEQERELRDAISDELATSKIKVPLSGKDLSKEIHVIADKVADSLGYDIEFSYEVECIINVKYGMSGEIKSFTLENVFLHEKI